jgi:hypothetical protein
MAEERDDPVPTDDPRDTETSDQNAEESHPGAAQEQEGDAGEATAKPDAAG